MAAKKEATIEVVLVEPVQHDGVDHPVGATVQLPAAAAEALLASGAARVAGTQAAEQPAG